MRVLIVLGFAIVFAAIVYTLFRQQDDEEEGSNTINPNDLRENSEQKSLLVGLTILVVAMVFLLSMTFGTIALILLASVFWLKVRQGQLLGQAVKVGPKQLPDIYTIAQTASRRLGQPLPDIFIVQDPSINAYAMGVIGRKSLVLNSATVEALTSDELCYVIGHELAHIKCGHTQWMVLTSLSDTMRLPFVSAIVGYILRGWSRKAEYTADRGGLLANQNLASSFSALAKLAIGKELYQQLDIEQLMAQEDAVGADLVAKLSEGLSDHPYIMHRAKSLQIFSQSNYYQNLIDV